MRHHYLDLKLMPFNEQTVREQDCILITTAHDNVDYKLLLMCDHLLLIRALCLVEN